MPVRFRHADDQMDDFQRVRLVLARRRRLGETFEQAWPLALSVLDTPRPVEADEHNREGTLAALGATRDEWQRAYERQPAPVRRREPITFPPAAREMAAEAA